MDPSILEGAPLTSTQIPLQKPLAPNEVWRGTLVPLDKAGINVQIRLAKNVSTEVRLRYEQEISWPVCVVFYEYWQLLLLSRYLHYTWNRNWIRI